MHWQLCKLRMLLTINDTLFPLGDCCRFFSFFYILFFVLDFTLAKLTNLEASTVFVLYLSIFSPYLNVMSFVSSYFW